ncbi:hypothetical protein M0804_011918 [Polistes exclamans]|nr:hypothetical protein M0804_011918 [Polistes exclamans]
MHTQATVCSERSCAIVLALMHQVSYFLCTGGCFLRCVWNRSRIMLTSINCLVIILGFMSTGNVDLTVFI